MGLLGIIGAAVSMTTVYLALATIILFLIYDFWMHTYFWRMGIPGPRPLPIFGNIRDLFQNPSYEAIDGYVKKYGPVVGMYLWRSPIIIVTDPDILRDIMIKDHSKFYNRWPAPMESGVMDMAMFNLRDAQWKKVRDIVSPTFSGRKMKMMSTIVNDCADIMIDNIHAACKKDETIECKELLGGFVMDTVARCAFGLKINSQRDKDDPFVTHASRMFKVLEGTPALFAVLFMPWLRHVFKLFKVMFFPKDVINFFTEVTEKAIAMRSSGQPKPSVDFLQLLIDAQKGENQAVNENDDDDVHNKYFDGSAEMKIVSQSHRNARKPLTKEELLGQAMIFLIAGYETTTAALMLGAYLLATNPDCQDKLFEEIDRLAPTRDDVSYSAVSKMPYLDQVLCETLRIYPPAALANRECGETVTYQGNTIERGMQVWIPSYSVHRDPKNWPEPTKFNPDRFSKENSEGRDPFHWIPFGAGPRMCVGMRFALMEAKMALVRILQEVRLEVSPETQIPPKLGSSAILSPPNGITLKVTPRHYSADI